MTVPYLNLWTLAWNHHWLKGETDTYWDANLFYPHRKTLAYSEPQLGMGLLTFPLLYLGTNQVLMYNLLLLGFMWGAGMVVYALCWHLFGTSGKENSNTKSDRSYCWIVSVTAGILYGFHFYVFAEMGVLQLIATLFPPLTLLGVHRFLSSSNWTDAFLFCIGFLGCWYTCAYYGLFLTVFVCCFVLKFGYRKVLDMEWKTLIRGVLAGMITLVCLVPLITGMQSAKAAMELSRPKFLVRDLSAVLSDYFKFPQHSWFYGNILGIGSPDRGTFLGVMLVFLSVIGGIAIFRERSLRNTDNCFLEKAGFPGYHGKFYLAMAGLAFWLSYGMAVVPWNTTGLGVYRVIAWLSPYNLLYQFIPGFSSIRSPYRFAIFCALFLSVLAGWGMLRLFERLRPRWRVVLIPMLVMLVLLEQWPLPLRLVEVPRRVEELPRIYGHVRQLPSEAVLLELPLARGPSEQHLEGEARALYYSSFHWLKIVNGYSGFSPLANIELKHIINESSPETVVAAFRAFGVQYVLAHEDKLNAAEKQKLKRLQGKELIPVAHEGTDRLYKVTANSTTSDQWAWQVRGDTLVNSSREVDTIKISLPEVAALTMYESRTSPDYVTLCLYYDMGDTQCELTTPWERGIQFEVTWYSQSEKKDPVLVSSGIHRDSRLITKKHNAIELDIPAPPPGEYFVNVQQRGNGDVRVFKGDAEEEHRLVEMGTRVMKGVCQIYEKGFVTFYNVD